MSKKFLAVLGLFLLTFVTMHIFALEKGKYHQNPQLQQLQQKMEQDMQQVKLDREKLKQDMRKVEQDRIAIYKLKRQLMNERYQKNNHHTNIQQSAQSAH